MPLPLIALLALSTAATAGSQYLSNKKRADSDRELTEAGIASEEAMQRQQLALEESKLNPFRHQAFQASTAAGLDQMERGTYSPVKITAPSRYAQYVPQVSGGYSYQKSPELTQGAGILKNDVLAGRTAPSALNLNPVPPSFAGRGTMRSPESERLAVMDLLRLIYGDDAPYPAGQPPLQRGPGPSGARRQAQGRSGPAF